MSWNEREEIEKMISDSSTWPGETFCVKRRAKDGEPRGTMGYAAFGCIVTTGTPIEIYLRGDTPATDFETSQRYDSIDAMLEDGWIID